MTKWPMVPIRYLGQVTLGKMLQTKAKSPTDQELPYFRAAHIQRNGKIIDAEPKMMWFSAKERVSLTLAVGDVVVVEGGAIGRSAHINESRPGWGFQNSIVRIRPWSGQSIGRFIDYALQSALAEGRVELVCNTATLSHFTAEKVSAFQLPAPDPDTQTAIADYLDRETAKIDALIGKQCALIDGLRERKAAATERTVQNGEWPAVPIGSVSTLVQTGPFGSQISADDYVDNGAYLINPAHMRGGVIVPAESVSVDEKTAMGLARHQIRRGDIVIARRGELGRCAVARPKDEGSLCGTGSILVRVRQNLVEPEFLAMAFSSRRNSDHLLQQSVGSTMNNINAGIVSRTRIPLPAIQVQREVLQQVSRENTRTNDLIFRSERLIELSRERRCALITAAVTGQIDVREMKSGREAA